MSTIYLSDIEFFFSLEYKLHAVRMLLFWLLTNLQWLVGTQKLILRTFCQKYPFLKLYFC